MSEQEVLIRPAQLTFAAVTDGAERRYGAAYEYTADKFDKVAGSFLFWGPYLDLDAGVYVLDFIGEVEGGLAVEFIHDFGRMRIKRLTLGDFASPACIVLVRSVKKFEIRAIKTPTLKQLKLEGIRLHCVYRGAAGAA